ncbi:hypothetical protein BDZ85DRAFT_125616 [Elsinoe ampelina]|uniref:RNAse P Rpr2/Rpp21/SNM1 subunit domain-containing protein n=1 Tax=Elsinoe ampelina TaxID=302913 RepID=A0A6A6G938_9PEZI|nr:hypothetical protein BDZ85DRAFT_125616 [Elsinoe ampelina]
MPKGKVVRCEVLSGAEAKSLIVSASSASSNLSITSQHTSMDMRRLKYLEEASVLLQTQSPAISSHLGLQSILFTLPASIASSSPPANNCQSCGTCLVPSWSCIRVQRQMARSPLLAEESSKDSLIYRCNKCGCLSTSKRRSRTARQCKISESAQKMASDAPKQISQVLDTAPPPMSDDKVNTQAQGGRKRAKNRKSAGLGALIARNQPSEAPKGFDLMDFMKST